MAKRPDRLTEHVREVLVPLIKKSPRTQIALADEAGIDPADLSRFKTGRLVNPTMEFLDAVARLFHRRLVDIISEGSRPLPNASDLRPDEAEVLAYYRDLFDEQSQTSARAYLSDFARLSRVARAAGTPEPPANTPSDPKAGGRGRGQRPGTLPK